MTSSLLTSPERIARHRSSDSIDFDRIEHAVREILYAIGEDPDRDGLSDTPRRVARSYSELFRGLRESGDVPLSVES